MMDSKWIEKECDRLLEMGVTEYCPSRKQIEKALSAHAPKPTPSPTDPPENESVIERARRILREVKSYALS
jgi:hypothetical protein